VFRCDLLNLFFNETESRFGQEGAILPLFNLGPGTLQPDGRKSLHRAGPRKIAPDWRSGKSGAGRRSGRFRQHVSSNAGRTTRICHD
jgi:hypothetical protein